MTNSPIEIADALTIVGKLIDRTREGKLQWQADGRDFVTTLGPNLRATVAESSFFDFSVVEFDATLEEDLMAHRIRIPDKDLVRLSIEKNPAYGYDTVDEKILAEMLRDLVVLARRSALDVNSSMKRALIYLDQIAG